MGVFGDSVAARVYFESPLDAVDDFRPRVDDGFGELGVLSEYVREFVEGRLYFVPG